MGCAQDLIDVAYSYLGTTEDDPRFTELIDYYNEHTDGYDMRYWDEWCACFVSVCSLKSGNADVTGTSVNCAAFRSIWIALGILRPANSIPEPGWFIEYDWQQDGIPDHIGIVVDCDGETIHVIEGNTDGEMCAEHWIPVGSQTISCFGAPNYTGESKEEGFDMAECVFHCDSDHEGYKKGDMVHWSTSTGFLHLPHMDCVHLMEDCGVRVIETGATHPWIMRAKQSTQPELVSATYGKR